MINFLFGLNGEAIIIGEKNNYQAVLLRCGCTHDFWKDIKKYRPTNIIIDYGAYCHRCALVGWRITGKTDDQLRRREV